MLKRVNLQTRLFLAFLVPSSIALFTTVGSIVTISRLNAYSRQLSENNLPSLDGLWKISEGLNRIEATKKLLLHSDLTPSEHAAALDKVQQAWNQINDGERQALATPANQDLEKQLEAQFYQNWSAWKQAHQKFLEQERQFRQTSIPVAEGHSHHPGAKHDDPITPAQARMLAIYQETQSLSQATTDAVRNLLKTNQEFAARIQTDTIGATQQAQTVALLVLLLTPPVVGLLAWKLSRKIAHPIDQQLANLIGDLEAARDNLEAKVEERTQALQQSLQQLSRTQSQLVQAEKMSSLGQLVAGIAHEINNPINFIHGNLVPAQEHAQILLDTIELYQKHVPNPTAEIQNQLEEADLEFIQEDFPKILSSIRMGTDRIRQIVLSLRNFSRMDEAEFKAVDLHDGLENTLLILQHRLKDKPECSAIQVIRDYGELPPIECYPGQLNQAFMNILANAIDALEDANQTIPLEASTTEEHSVQERKAQPNQITVQTKLIDSTWVRISIADNGVGMPESVQQRIFDPFFTTKAIGKGTGMGMSITYQIITEKHGGKLSCFSQPGQGTEFIIQIPIRQANVAT